MHLLSSVAFCNSNAVTIINTNNSVFCVTFPLYSSFYSFKLLYHLTTTTKNQVAIRNISTLKLRKDKSKM